MHGALFGAQLPFEVREMMVIFNKWQIPMGTSLETIGARFRVVSSKKHPDHGGSHEEFLEVTAEKEKLMRFAEKGYARHAVTRLTDNEVLE